MSTPDFHSFVLQHSKREHASTTDSRTRDFVSKIINKPLRFVIFDLRRRQYQVAARINKVNDVNNQLNCHFFHIVTCRCQVGRRICLVNGNLLLVLLARLLKGCLNCLPDTDRKLCLNAFLVNVYT